MNQNQLNCLVNVDNAFCSPKRINPTTTYQILALHWRLFIMEINNMLLWYSFIYKKSDFEGI